MIFDTHAHYDDEAFEEDREQMLSSLQGAKIERVINVGASLETTASTIALADRYPFVYAAAGVHPESTPELNEETFSVLKKQCRHPKVVAVGEIGLDYYWDEPDRGTQRYWFRRQLRLAGEEKLPVIIHSREAAKDTLEIMQEENSASVGGVIHCYSYSKELARTFLEMGFYFGIGGVLTFKNGRKLKEAVSFLPIQSILLETDCPYLAPAPFRGKRNSSLYLPCVVEAIASIKGISADEVERITTENAYRLFTGVRR